MGADKDHVTGAEPFDAVADELSTVTLFEIDELDLGMVMPAVIDIGQIVPSCVKGIDRVV